MLARQARAAGGERRPAAGRNRGLGRQRARQNRDVTPAEWLTRAEGRAGRYKQSRRSTACNDKTYRRYLPAAADDLGRQSHDIVCPCIHSVFFYLLQWDSAVLLDLFICSTVSVSSGRSHVGNWRFLVQLFRSTPPSRPNNISGSQMSVRPYVRPSTKRFFDFNEIWYVGRGRRVMHDGMQYDLIQRQGQGHEPTKVGNSTIFKGYLLPHL